MRNALKRMGAVLLALMLSMVNVLPVMAANEAVVGGGNANSTTGNLSYVAGSYGYANRTAFSIIYAGWGAEVYAASSLAFGPFDDSYQFWFLAGQQCKVDGTYYNAGTRNKFTISNPTAIKPTITPGFCGVRSSATSDGKNKTYWNRCYYRWVPSAGYWDKNKNAIGGCFRLETESQYIDSYMVCGYDATKMKSGLLGNDVTISKDCYGLYDDLFKAILYHVGEGNLYFYKTTMISGSETSMKLNFDEAMYNEMKDLYTKYFERWGDISNDWEPGGYVSTYGSYDPVKDRDKIKDLDYWHLSKADYNTLYNYFTSYNSTVGQGLLMLSKKLPHKSTYKTAREGGSIVNAISFNKKLIYDEEIQIPSSAPQIFYDNTLIENQSLALPSADGWYNAKTISQIKSFTSTDEDKDLVSFDLYYNGGLVKKGTIGSDNKGTITYDFKHEGIREYELVATDSIGNKTSKKVTVRADFTPPSLLDVTNSEIDWGNSGSEATYGWCVAVVNPDSSFTQQGTDALSGVASVSMYKYSDQKNHYERIFNSPFKVNDTLNNYPTEKGIVIKVVDKAGNEFYKCILNEDNLDIKVEPFFPGTN